MKRATQAAIIVLGSAPLAATAQVPDLVNALDAGGRAMGMGGAGYATGSDSFAGYYNPAGLGFVNRATLDLSFRNMPESSSVVTGDIGPSGTQRLDTQGETGPTSLGHAGVAFPLKNRSGGTNGAISLSLTKGGVIRDFRTSGPGLTEGGLSAAGFSQLLKVSTDFVNLAYGKSSNDGSFNWGFGLVYAINRQTNQRFAPSGTTLFDEDATGLGVQAGIQMNPKGNGNVSFGLSVRSPISLKGGSGANGLIYRRIPGRVLAGAAVRQDGYRGGRDYIIFGGEVQHFFNGEQSQFVDRNSQTVFGLGVEYNLGYGGGRVPIRLGYSMVQAGGDFFGSRNAFTFGFGYRPSNGDWGLDLNWARPNGGGNDLSLSMSYKFGK